jgi:CHAT domain-containing protein
MGPSLKSEETIRDYLLGRVSDETTLEGLEELLFTDEDFCSEVELAEDALINDYVFGVLSDADTESFSATLEDNPERRFKVDLTRRLQEKARARSSQVADERPSFLSSLAFLFHQPAYAGAFAVLLIAAVALVVYFSRRPSSDDLAELRTIYRQARPTETRISEFDYAPFSQLRGAPAPSETNRLRRIENNLIESTEKSASPQAHHALGIFYLTQRDYRKALTELESAARLADSDARIHNDLGSAHFELAMNERKLEDLNQSLEEFTKATELDGNLLPAIFNKSLALQQLGLTREARASWEDYLRKDPSSPWADEARKNLAGLEGLQSLDKPASQVLLDFLAAYRDGDAARAQKIHNETKGLLRDVTVPIQLSRRYLMARQSNNEAEATESIEALRFIGTFEKAQNGESFFFELANFYASADPGKFTSLLQAHDLAASGQNFVEQYKYAEAMPEFEKSRDLFTNAGDPWDAAIAELWAAQFLSGIGSVDEMRRRMSAIVEYSTSRNYKVLLPIAYYWMAMSYFNQSGLSETNRHLKTALRWAEATNNTFGIRYAQDNLTSNYSRLGDMPTALAYASATLDDRGLYYLNHRQSWRQKGTLADLSIKLGFFATAVSLARERLGMIRERPDDVIRLNDSLRQMAQAAQAKGELDEALQCAGESLQLALARDDSKSNTITKAEIHLLLANVQSRKKDFSAALSEYNQALELYHHFPEVRENLYEIHKGRLFCFEQLDRQEEFAVELVNVLKLSEEYRATIREDTLRQSFFANQQIVFDTAATNAIKAGDSRKAFEFVEASKARSLLDFVESGKSIAEVEKGFGAVTRPLTLPEIQARLPENMLFVEYAVLPDRLLLWIVSKTHFDMGAKDIAALELEKKVASYQAAILAKASPAEIRAAGRELYDLLIPPGLSQGQALCLVPDKSLHELAFTTLIAPGGNYLLEEHAIFYSPSASVLVLASENARRKEQLKDESLLSVGNPDFEQQETQELANLQAAETEAKTIAGDYSKPLQLIGSEATKEKFLANLRGVQVVHFAGHFVTNRKSPANSKLLFAQGELRSAELGNYKLPLAKLVVLSACETGFENYNKSEGAIGIARIWLAMGAPVVVASQWKVDSEPTKDLMIAFHHNRKRKGMTSAESLRQAQLEVLRRNETQAPFYWAAFSLFGGYANY